MKRALEKNRLTLRIFYDCETSGQGCAAYRQDRIIEIAAVTEAAAGTANTILGLTRKSPKVEDTLPEGYFSSLVQGGPSTNRAFAVHGIRPEAISQARSFPDVWLAFKAFVHAAQLREPWAKAISLVGHNSFSTDNYWLLTELHRADIDVKDLTLDGRRLVFEDVYPRTEESRKQLKKSLGLSSLRNSDIHAKLFGGSAQEAHHALWDCAATKQNWQDARVACFTRRMSLAQQLGHWDLVLRKAALEKLLDDVSDIDE
jgi:DNA polymerase III epsilon subunit-like protein